MSDSCQSLKHMPFFEELAKTDDCDATWKSIAAGLVVTRLVDELIAAGPAATQADSWRVSAVREAIGVVTRKTTPLRRILSAITDSVTSSSTTDIHVLCPRLMAFGQALEYEARWAPAADVYRTIIEHSHPFDDADLVVSAYIQLAFCLRSTGELDESARAYSDAAEVADAAGDLIGVLRARLGDAKTAIARGNMPRAEDILDSTIATARGQGLGDLQSHALHERAPRSRSPWAVRTVDSLRVCGAGVGAKPATERSYSERHRNELHVLWPARCSARWVPRARLDSTRAIRTMARGIQPDRNRRETGSGTSFRSISPRSRKRGFFAAASGSFTSRTSAGDIRCSASQSQEFLISSARSRWPRATDSIRCCSRPSKPWLKHERALLSLHSGRRWKSAVRLST